MVALRIIGTLPVASCECERLFSALRSLKTYTLSTMFAERLNDIVLLHIYKDSIVKIDKVITLFAMQNKILKFCWINILKNGCLNESRILQTKTLSSVPTHSVQSS